MRLIDADAYSAEMKDRQEAAWKWRNEAIAEEDEVKLARAEGAFTAFTEAKLTMDKHIISTWHRVEEPPREEGRYWCAVWFDGHWIFDAAWYTHDISTVIDVPCCERVGGFYKGNTEVHPDYWMPIEPPKEEEHGN